MAQMGRCQRGRTHPIYNSGAIFIGSNGKLYRDPLPCSTMPNCTTPAAAVANLLDPAQPATLIPYNEQFWADTLRLYYGDYRRPRWPAINRSTPLPALNTASCLPARTDGASSTANSATTAPTPTARPLTRRAPTSTPKPRATPPKRNPNEPTPHPPPAGRSGEHHRPAGRLSR